MEHTVYLHARYELIDRIDGAIYNEQNEHGSVNKEDAECSGNFLM